MGREIDISHALRLLRIALPGPSRTELERWQTDEGLCREWLRTCHSLALKDDAGEVIPVQDFFNLFPYGNTDSVRVGGLTNTRLGNDVYEVDNERVVSVVDLSQDNEIQPPYQVVPDSVPGGLVKMGLEVLGGASGFSPNEPCTGLALCYSGDYLLIDAIPWRSCKRET